MSFFKICDCYKIIIMFEKFSSLQLGEHSNTCIILQTEKTTTSLLSEHDCTRQAPQLVSIGTREIL